MDLLSQIAIVYVFFQGTMMVYKSEKIHDGEVLEYEFHLVQCLKKVHQLNIQCDLQFLSFFQRYFTRLGKVMNHVVIDPSFSHDYWKLLFPSSCFGTADEISIDSI